MYHESFQSINLLSSMKRRKMKKMVIHDLGFKRCTKIALSFCQDIHLIAYCEMKIILFFVNLRGKNMFLYQWNQKVYCGEDIRLCSWCNYICYRFLSSANDYHWTQTLIFWYEIMVMQNALIQILKSLMNLYWRD